MKLPVIRPQTGHGLSAKLIALAAIVAGAVTLFAGFGAGAEQTLRGARDMMRAHAPSGEIVIVEIDAKSLHQLDHWPWPRRYHAALVDKLHAAGARSIAFDTDFSGRSTVADDATFAKALENAGGDVILPSFRQATSLQSQSFSENLPIPELRAHAFLASVNIHPDSEGLVRDYVSGVSTAGTIRPSLAGMVAEVSGRGSTNFTVDQSIDQTALPRVSFVDVINGKVPDALLRGKRMIVGATAIELGDRYAVPRHGVVPGVVIQAMAAETLLQGATNPTLGGAPLFLAALLILCAVMGGKSRGKQIAFVLLGLTAVLAAPLALEALGWATLETVPAIVVLLIAAEGIVAREIWRAFQSKTFVDQETQLGNGRALSRLPLSENSIIISTRIARFDETQSVVGAAGANDLIRRTAERIAFTAAKGDVFRTGEDTLAWVCDSEDADDVDDRIAALRALFRSPIQIGNRSVELSLTYGAARSNADDGRACASRALVATDHAGENGLRWAWHSQSLSAEIDWKLALLGELDNALADGQIWVAYQPKADVKTGEITSSEALVRWSHPERGLVPPDHFIPVIEQSGRIHNLTLFVLERALTDLSQWQALRPEMSVAVNISAPLLDDPAFAEEVSAVLNKTKVDPARVTLEITESAALANPERAVAAMERLCALGVKLSIDDYGTGQSTLSYLKRLPASEIKIDKSFITDLVDTRNDQILVRSTIELAHELGFKVVAEGIEDAACLALLASMGCDTAQGWHIGKPMPAAAFAEMLEPRIKLAA